jgi:hypothetical protein
MNGWWQMPLGVTELAQQRKAAFEPKVDQFWMKHGQSGKRLFGPFGRIGTADGFH